MKNTEKNVSLCRRKHRADRKHEHNLRKQGLGTCPHTDNVGTSRMHEDVLVPIPVTDERVIEFQERVSRLQVCIIIRTTLTLLFMILFVFIKLLTTFLCMRSFAFLCIARSLNKMRAIRSTHAREAHNLISTPCVRGTNLSSTSGTTLCFVHQHKCEGPQLQSCITSIIIIHERRLTTHSHTTLSLNEQQDLRLTQSSTAFIDYTLITLVELMLNVNVHLNTLNKTVHANAYPSDRSHSSPSTTCALPSKGGWEL